MKQTTVKWLYEKLERMIPRTALYNIDKESYIEQALEMEKEQIMNAYNQGYRDGEHDVSNIPLSIGDISDYNNAQDYYNEIYENKVSGGSEIPNNHIGDTNKMVDQVPDVEKLAEEVYLEHENNDLLYGESLELIHAYKAGIVDGYNKAKETLYTKEQVMDAIRLARQINYCNQDYEIIVSLKLK